MKIRARSIFFRRQASLLLTLLSLTIMMFSVVPVRAGLTVSINLYHTQYGYYMYPFLSTNNTPPNFPTGDYLIHTPNYPTTGSQLSYTAAPGSFNQNGGGGAYFNNYAALMNDITNGFWSIWVTNGGTTQYKFKVTVTGLTSNMFGAAPIVTFPLNDAQNVPDDSTFTWTGPANWAGGLFVNAEFIDENENYNYVDSASLPPTSTSWSPSVTLPAGTNYLRVDYNSNVTAMVVASTPTNSAGTAISGWTSTANLNANAWSVFVVVGNTFNQYLVGRYDFENLGTPGLDTSGNGNSANCSSSGGPMTDTPSSDAAVNDFARRYYGDTSICFTDGGTAFPNLSNALAGDFTVTAWVKTTATAGFEADDAQHGLPVLTCDNQNENSTTPLSMTGGKAAFTVRDDFGDPITLHSDTYVDDGTYHFLAVTRNRTTGAMKLYVDGNLEASDTGSTEFLDAGTYLSLAGGNNSYEGLLDDVRIYEAELTAGDIAQLFGGNTGPAIPDAVDATDLAWSIGGDALWFGQTGITHDAQDAARSGPIGDDEQSWIETTFTGPGTLSFWWRVSSDDSVSYDWLELTVDGNYYDEIAGDSGWNSYEINFAPGSHTVRWTYYKDFSDVDNLDAAFLDEVSFVPDVVVPTVITRHPFSQTNSPGYQVGLLADATSNAAITWQWYKTGSGLIAGATNSLYVPTNSGTAGVAGSYFAIATSTSGSATTTVASVTFTNATLPAEWSTMFKSPFSGITSGSIGNMNAGDYYLACVADGSTNIYAAGQFYGGHFINTTNQLRTVNPGACIVKHTTGGGTLWADGVTNNGNGQAYAVAVAAALDGGVYVVGNFSGTNWLGTNLLVAATTNGSDIFLARYTATGSNVWVKTIASTNSDFAILNAAATDSSGNLTVAGLVSAGANYAGTNVASTGQVSFLAQFNPAGSPLWVQVITNCFNLSLTASDQRLYAIGQNFAGTNAFYLGGQSITSDRRWIMGSLNPTNGQSFWLRGIGPHRLAENPLPLSDDVPRFSVVGTNILLAGTSYSNTATFGTITVNFPADRFQYFARYDTSGTAHAATSIGSEFTSILSLVADAAGNSYCAGDFENYSDFGGHVVAGYPRGRTIATASYFSHSVIAKLDLNGNTQWIRPGIATASHLGYNNANYSNFRGVTRTSDGRIWGAGLMWGQVNFNTNLLTGDIEIVSMQAFPVRTAFLAAVAESAIAAPAPITLLNPQTSGPNFQFQFQSQAGFTHAVQYRTNLVTGQTWQTYSNVTGDGGVKIIGVPQSLFNPAGQGFIRISTQ